MIDTSKWHLSRDDKPEFDPADWMHEEGWSVKLPGHKQWWQFWKRSPKGFWRPCVMLSDDDQMGNPHA